MPETPVTLLSFTNTPALPLAVLAVVFWILCEIVSAWKKSLVRDARLEVADPLEVPVGDWKWAFGLMGLALALRLPLLFFKGINHLEFSYIAVPMTANSFKEVVFNPIALQQGHLPLPHLILYIISKISDRLFVLRLPSLIFSLLAVMGTHRLGVMLGGRTPGRIAGGLAAISAAMIFYSADATAYALLACLGSWFLAALFDGIEYGKSRAYFFAGLLAAMLFWTSAFQLLALIGVGAVFLALAISSKRAGDMIGSSIRVIRMLSRASLLTIPGFIFIFTTHEHSRSFLLHDKSLYFSPARALLFPYEWIRFSFGIFPFLGVAALIAGTLVGFGIHQMWKRQRAGAKIALGFIAVSILAEFTFATILHLRTGGYPALARHHLAFAPLLFVLVCVSLNMSRQRSRYAAGALFVLVLCQTACIGFLYQEQLRDPMKTAVKIFLDRSQDGDAFAVLPRFYYAHADYLMSGGKMFFGLGPRWREAKGKFYGPLDPNLRWIGPEGVSLFCKRFALAVIHERLLGASYFEEHFADNDLIEVGMRHTLIEEVTFWGGIMRYYNLRHIVPPLEGDTFEINPADHSKMYFHSPYYRGPYPHKGWGLSGDHEFAFPDPNKEGKSKVTVVLKCQRESFNGSQDRPCDPPKPSFTQQSKVRGVVAGAPGVYSTVLMPASGGIQMFEIHFLLGTDTGWTFDRITVKAMEKESKED